MAPRLSARDSPVGTDAGWSPSEFGGEMIMAHGPRGGRVRAAFTGLGFALCVWASAGSIGCTNPDKPAPKPAQKFDANGRPIPPGLPGTTTIPGASGSGNVGLNRTGPSMGISPAPGMG